MKTLLYTAILAVCLNVSICGSLKKRYCGRALSEIFATLCPSIYSTEALWYTNEAYMNTEKAYLDDKEIPLNADGEYLNKDKLLLNNHASLNIDETPLDAEESYLNTEKALSTIEEVLLDLAKRDIMSTNIAAKKLNRQRRSIVATCCYDGCAIYEILSYC